MRLGATVCIIRMNFEKLSPSWWLWNTVFESVLLSSRTQHPTSFGLFCNPYHKRNRFDCFSPWADLEALIGIYGRFLARGQFNEKKHVIFWNERLIFHSNKDRSRKWMSHYSMNTTFIRLFYIIIILNGVEYDWMPWHFKNMWN